jgi:hypothetical protein
MKNTRRINKPKNKNTRKQKINKKNNHFQYTKKEYNSNDGMLTSVWGPGLWHFLHTISFNYPVKPTQDNKKYYKSIITNLKYVLPCNKCRINLKKNIKELPLKPYHLQNRDTFSLYVYNLHELVNKMLNKKSGLSYNQIRNRYEHFRARCNNNTNKGDVQIQHTGCSVPFEGFKKTKCILKIIPHDRQEDTFQIDSKCLIKR